MQLWFPDPTGSRFLDLADADRAEVIRQHPGESFLIGLRFRALWVAP
jgi:hypothetical protein